MDIIRKEYIESMDLIIFEDVIFFTVLCCLTSFLTNIIYL
jgi:hypothetical protein